MELPVERMVDDKEAAAVWEAVEEGSPEARVVAVEAEERLEEEEMEVEAKEAATAVVTAEARVEVVTVEVREEERVEVVMAEVRGEAKAAKAAKVVPEACTVGTEEETVRKECNAPSPSRCAPPFRYSRLV